MTSPRQAQKVTGLSGGLEFTGTPEHMADLIEEWVTPGGSDGFTLQPTTTESAGLARGSGRSD